MQSSWTPKKTDTSRAESLSQGLKISQITAGILLQRGIETQKEAEAFLNPNLTQLTHYPPKSLLGMKEATQRVAQAITTGEPILICGDYDADGITATSVLATFLRQTGAQIFCHLPHRITHGYGFHASQIHEQAIPNGVKLIITVDCGSTSFEAVDEANRHGIDVIITDHHTTGKTLPQAFAIINPKQPTCPSGLENLAGVGLAFYLAASLRAELRAVGHWETMAEPNMKSLCDMVALGTIADIVPLTKVNRILTQAGLEVINTTPRPGIASLLTASKVNKERVDAEDIAFRLAPRINAAGRMEAPDTGLDLMLSPTLKSALPLAKSLCTLNSRRQDEEARIFEEIKSYLDETPAALEKKALVLAKNGWHPGVLGIVASRVVREYGKPAFVISVNERGVGKGSGRSIPGIDLYQALCSAADQLIKFGGHHQAAGLEVEAKQIGAFHKSVENHLNQTTCEADYDVAVPPDALLPLAQISPELIDELERLAPFGEGNREPLFMAENVRVLSSSEVGRGHRRFLLEIQNSPHYDKCMAIRFNHPQSPFEKRIEKMLYALRWNRWNGGKSPQILIHDMV